MIKFLFKGLMRDRSRSWLPITVVALGVCITVFLQAYMAGVMGDSIESTAQFSTGHVKVMTHEYSRLMSQLPNDLDLENVSKLEQKLIAEFPDMTWVCRTSFGGMVSAVRAGSAQGSVMGMGVNLSDKDEINRLNLQKALCSGQFPSHPGQVMITDQLFKKMKLHLNDSIRLGCSDRYGRFVIKVYRVCGLLHFGINALDRGTVVVDLTNVSSQLCTPDGAGQVLGFFNGKKYNNQLAHQLVKKFNDKYYSEKVKGSPIMLPLSDMEGMAFFISYSEIMQWILMSVFIFAMSIVLWNAGLIGGLRRYGEFGLRLAIGESKSELYLTLLAESFLVGVVGSVIGVSLGLAMAWYMQKYGYDIGDMMKDANVMLPSVLRAQINSTTYYIGFIPGIFSTVLGAALAGIGVFRRQTANLFKELEG
jgi:putative ABC transport system permease protein